MDYQQTLEYLFSRLPMFSRIGAAAYKADLGNTRILCSAIGEPHQQFRSIHIAGTNGKGSTSHMLAAIFQAAGYTTGLYTSPHLKDFRERIRVNGAMIPERQVIAFTEKIRPLIESIHPSFFEITVAMAFEYFVYEKVDIAIIETGLGGRLDSTNIITPELSVITNIGWDHMNMLGDSLEQIAAEKAGIIKPGVPVVLGEWMALTGNIIKDIAEKSGSSFSVASAKRRVTDWHWEKHELVAEVATANHSDHQVYHLDLPGIYQLKNLLTTLEACTVMQSRGWNLTDENIRNGIKKARKLTGLHGRWDVILSTPMVVIDVAHNEDGVKMLVQQLEVTDHQQLHIVIGLVKDKEVEKVLGLLPRNARYYFTKAQIPRALPEKELEAIGKRLQLEGETWPGVNAAIQAALEQAGPKDLVVICGSVYLAGEVNTSIRPVFPKHT